MTVRGFTECQLRNTGQMWITGVQVSASSAAHLAYLLDRAGHSQPAQRLGIAIDRNVDDFGLLPGEDAQMLDVLDDPVDGLAALRKALLGR
jgi:hypothetical protein